MPIPFARRRSRAHAFYGVQAITAQVLVVAALFSVSVLA